MYKCFVKDPKYKYVNDDRMPLKIRIDSVNDLKSDILKSIAPNFCTFLEVAGSKREIKCDNKFIYLSENQLFKLHQNNTCGSCLCLIKEPCIFQDCSHKICYECGIKQINKNCPQCRIKVSNKRKVKPHPIIGYLKSLLFPIEKEADKFYYYFSGKYKIPIIRNTGVKSEIKNEQNDEETTENDELILNQKKEALNDERVVHEAIKMLKDNELNINSTNDNFKSKIDYDTNKDINGDNIANNNSNFTNKLKNNTNNNNKIDSLMNLSQMLSYKKKNISSSKNEGKLIENIVVDKKQILHEIKEAIEVDFKVQVFFNYPDNSRINPNNYDEVYFRKKDEEFKFFNEKFNNKTFLIQGTQKLSSLLTLIKYIIFGDYNYDYNFSGYLLKKSAFIRNNSFCNEVKLKRVVDKNDLYENENLNPKYDVICGKDNKSLCSYINLENIESRFDYTFKQIYYFTQQFFSREPVPFKNIMKKEIEKSYNLGENINYLNKFKSPCDEMIFLEFLLEL